MGREPFRDRTDAGTCLARKLGDLRPCNPLVAAIPRGGVPVGRVIADALGAELDVVLTAASLFPDVDQSGALGRGFAEKLRRRRILYTGQEEAVEAANRTVIVVDDGMATVPTLLAAIRAIRARRPRRLVVATPIASPSALDLLSGEADEIRVLAAPPAFESIRQFYRYYPSVSDLEVTSAFENGRVVRPAAALLVGPGAL
ncbi:MAG: phosphoribosyltransferase [Deltaproteobacteria bacterium]|nr:phosphoribosyltransferase [Deltaproteobacteria bacterium]